MTTLTTSHPTRAVPLLRLSEREQAGLRWLKGRARYWLTALKRRRKRLPRGAPYGVEEAEILKALLALEAATGALLGLDQAARPPPRVPAKRQGGMTARQQGSEKGTHIRRNEP